MCLCNPQRLEKLNDNKHVCNTDKLANPYIGYPSYWGYVLIGAQPTEREWSKPNVSTEAFISWHKGWKTGKIF